MKLTRKEFERIRPMGNTVLIRPFRLNDEVVVGENIRLYIDTSWSDGEWICVTGEVVAVPEKLSFRRYDTSTMEWLTDMELKPGDVVWYDFVDGKNAFGNHYSNETRFVDVEGEIYIFVPYGSCFVAKRGDDTIMLNGYVLAEPVDDEIKTTLKLPDTIDRRSTSRAIVTHIGSCNREYRNEGIPPDMPELAVGDMIVFRKNADIELEYSLLATFDGKKPYFRIQRKHIVAIIKEPYYAE